MKIKRHSKQKVASGQPEQRPRPVPEDTSGLPAIPALAPAAAPKAPEGRRPRERTPRQGDPAPRQRDQEASRDRRAPAGGRNPGREPGRGRSPAPAEHVPTTGRVFYALKVPTSVSGRLVEAQRQLKGNWRTVKGDQMHVTLCYLPAVPLARVPELKALGVRLMSGLEPMNVRVRGTGYFPNEGSPRVWFVKVEAEGLNELAAALRAGVQELGLETEEQPFKAHITLARKKGPAPRVPPMTFELGWTANGGTLQRSHLQKTGPIYETLSAFRFRSDAGQPAPPGGASHDTASTSTSPPSSTDPHPLAISPDPDPQEPS
ncbi:RNA 2',3'-cyclic phosphodiesterase [Deinococcus aerophilus]|uniref:RNA 2',3'-cyclic phosphodiesterase n=1 Tax=Deinococcus aerophilus TaxID=522488 RepID=A0ABQ2GUY9_9DEIO|nr:RNA 2',3'-cyclic phosphodiesterase [Deinococcus aerophilus]GGM14622.1 hypothetical protein GCM10010841_24050 [Deinococcus aerophilus]